MKEIDYIKSEKINEIKSDGPLTVRVDSYYKQKFNDLVENSFHNKKEMMELMIATYINGEKEKERESTLSFESDINLISINLNDILDTFKRIAIKSQDTLASERSLYEQNLKISNINLQELTLKIKELEDRNLLLQASNDGYNLEKEKLINTITTLKAENENLNSNIKETKLKNHDFLEEINILRNAEKENLLLNAEKLKLEKIILELKEKNSDINNELSKAKSQLLEFQKISEAAKELHQKELQSLKTKENIYITEFKEKVYQEANIDKKLEMLKLQEQINILQIENLKYLNLINSKDDEIRLLKNPNYTS